MSAERLLQDITDGGIGRISFNRPEVHNAFDDDLILELTNALSAMDENPAVRVVELRGNGKSFCAGADLNWMKRVAGYSNEENQADATRLAAALAKIHQMNTPSIAVVQGAAYGGGVGVVAACDIAVAASSAKFCFSEAKLGLLPAVISPFCVAAIGSRQARKLFLTAERFSASFAADIGLIHDCVADADLDTKVAEYAELLCGYGTQTLGAIKTLVAAVNNRPIDAGLLADVAKRIADQRATAEGQEGIQAFLEKRKPLWPRSAN